MKFIIPLSGPLVLPCVHNNTIAEQRTQIEQLTAQVATLQTQATSHQGTTQALTAERDQARAELTAARASAASITTERDTAVAARTLAETNLATAHAGLTAAQAQVTTIESRANRLLASMGHAPLAMSGEADPANPVPTNDGSPAAVMAEYKAIKGHQERAKFYAANHARMFPKSKK